MKIIKHMEYFTQYAIRKYAGLVEYLHEKTDA